MALLQIPVAGLPVGGGLLGSRSRSTSFLGRDHLHLPRILGGHCGSGTPGSDYRRNQGHMFGPRLYSDGRRDIYRTLRSDSRQKKFNPEVSSVGKQYGFASPRSDFRRAQGRSFNYQQNGYDTPWVDSLRNQENDSSSQRKSQAGNDRQGYVNRNGSRGSDIGGASRGQGRSKASGPNNSRKTPNPTTQTVTPRQSASQLVSDSPVYRAPWEQGVRKSSSGGFAERDFTQKNPLIERLQRMPEEEGNDDDDNDFGDHDDGRGFRGFDEDEIARFSGSGEKSAMSRIAEKLSSIPGSRKIYEPKNERGNGLREGPDSTFDPKYGQPMFPNVGLDWSTPDHPVPTPAAPSAKKFRPDTRFPWEREDDRGADEAREKLTRVKPPSLAELILPEDELKRLRTVGLLKRHRVKVGRLGVTNGIVESIHNEWRNSEVVRVRCEGPPARNMKRTHEALEERTAGLVVWRAGGACLVYRGKDYVLPRKELLDVSEESTIESEAKISEESISESAAKNSEESTSGSAVEISEASTSESAAKISEDTSESAAKISEESTTKSAATVDECKTIEECETDEVDKSSNQQTAAEMVIVPRVDSVYDPELEREMEEVLSTLGPRYDDWTGMKPVPVDADLLIGPHAMFKKPFRLLPHGVKAGLSNLEMTNLRRLGRPIPPHFVLGINKGLDGLAAAIVKLWEKTEIAKIAVKRGVQNTNHDRMAEQLKHLTGGVLLARDKYFIVLYRGKDFLPLSVAAALEERQLATSALQEEKEVRFVPQDIEVLGTSVERCVAGALVERFATKPNREVLQNSDEEEVNREEASKAAGRDMTRQIQRKVFITLAKKRKAELELRRVEKYLQPIGPPVDRENITDEERHMFSKLGLKMHAFLLLGRRGVFDGTIENMHLHWKHRELVKIIYKAKNKIDLEQTARMIEYESGGILVGTRPTNKGQAILVYRGKNYQRPPELRPRTLLTKREALKRSIEMQRQKALAKHLLALENNIENMQTDLNKLEQEEEVGTSEQVANNSVDFPSETKDPIILSGFPEKDCKLIGDGSVGYPSTGGKLDVIFRADPLSRREKLKLRQEALKERKRTAHFNVGRSNVVAGLARAIRIHFQRHAVVKVGVRGRARGTPVEEILFQLEEATGGTLVSQESCKIILYRGWPEGQQRPTEGNGHWEEVPPELRSAMISEMEPDDDYLHESDWDQSGDEDEGGEGEQDDDFLGTQATVDSSEIDDDSHSDEFGVDGDGSDSRNELELGSQEFEEDLDEANEEAKYSEEKVLVNDVV